VKKVVILQYRLLHYRTSLFDQLRHSCQEIGVNLHLVHGQPTKREEKKRDVSALPWADKVESRYISIGKRDVLWQPFPAQHRDADLVVMMQENRLLSNYPWLFLRGLHQSKVAYWGHGRNFQSPNPSGLLETWKKYLVNRVDWWFAYTEMTRDILLSDGFPAERITVLDNAIDNKSFTTELSSITEARLAELRVELGIENRANVGLFCGSLYPDKRLDYMVMAADRIREVLPDFHLLVIGDGPSAVDIKEAAATRPWLHWLGVRKGVEKAACFRLSHVIFNPGALGLHVLDAFVSGVPLATTLDAKHGPEISYLKDGENGVVVQGGAGAYADVIIRILQEPSFYTHLKSGSLVSAQRYTLQNMVDNFVGGINRCLIMERKM
jgi:glycosyltransferase involved in cell wall biosynthesis